MARPHPALIQLAAGRPVSTLSDPDQLLRSAAEHRMTGLLWSSARLGEVELPREHHRELARFNLRVRAHHKRLWEAAEQITRQLALQGFEVATAKGVTAELRWFNLIGERPCADLDLLVDPAQLTRVAELVAALQPEHSLLDDLDELVGRGFLQAVDVWVNGIPVDLHVDIMKLGIPVRQGELIWERTQQLRTLVGGTVRVLDPEISLVQFILHLIKDRFSYLLGFVDVLRVIERSTIDWRFIDQFVRREGLDTHFYRALEVVFTTLGLTPPAHAHPKGWRAVAWDTLWPASLRLNGLVGRAEHHRRQLWVPFTMRGRLGSATSALLGQTFPPRSLLDYYYPDTSGAYPRRLTAGRLKRARERRHRIAEMIASETRLEFGAIHAMQLHPVPTTEASDASSGYKDFPPRLGHIKLPINSPDAALAGIAMYTPCRPWAVWGQRAAWVGVRLAGARALPGPISYWTPGEDWSHVAQLLRAELGPFDSMSVYERLQEFRTGFAVLLLRAGQPVAFVKSQIIEASMLQREKEALTAVRRSDPQTFGVPRVLTSGTAGRWGYLAVEPLTGLHHPPRKPHLPEILAEIQSGLDELPKPGDTPNHWVPMHGDFTPWNLREFSRSRRILIDWEDAGWGPPGADEVLYRAAEAALFGNTVSPDDYPEARAYWREHARFMEGSEQKLLADMLRRLT